MNAPTTQRDSHWLICESQERWYRAVCRFAPIILPEANIRIERMTSETTRSTVGKLKPWRGQVVVVWEIPAEAAVAMRRLDQIAALRSESRGVLQLASVSPGMRPEYEISAQEAGVSLFLNDLCGLYQFRKIIARHFRPLG